VEQILKCQYDFRGRRWKRTSDQAKDFIKDLLVLDPDDRLKADEALSCVWLNRRFAATTRAPHAEEETVARYAMIRYAGYTKLKKMVRVSTNRRKTTKSLVFTF
jgi:serine/threonine protein kinase